MAHPVIYTREAVEKIIQIISEGKLLREALVSYAKQCETKAPERTWFYRLVQQHNLEEEYFDACQIRDMIMNEDIIDDLDAIEPIVEFHDGIVTKYISNSCAIHKIEVKRRLQITLASRRAPYRLLDGVSLVDKLDYLDRLVSTGHVSPKEAGENIEYLERAMTVKLFDGLKDRMDQIITALKITQA